MCGSCLTFPNEEMYEHLMHILVYLGRSRNVGTTFSAHVPNADEMIVYADSDWGVTHGVRGGYGRGDARDLLRIRGGLKS